MAKKANPPNLAKPKPSQDQFLLQPNFWHLIFDTFVTIPHQDCTKIVTLLIHQFCYIGKKKPIHRTWLSQNPTQINSFCYQTFHSSFLIHLWQFPTKIAQKPITSLIHQFCYQGKKKPIHRTWLTQNPTKINSFSYQTFHSSFLMHLWQFPTKIARKPITSPIHQFCYQGKKSQSTELG